MTFLPDVNVWIACAVDGHTHHSAAKRWFDRTSEQIAFCRITEMGLLRLLTNTSVMAGAALTAALAWKVCDEFRNDPRVGFVREPIQFADRWRKTSSMGKVGPNFWTDAYLVSLCASADCTLVTFDKALSKRVRCKVQLLASE